MLLTEARSNFDEFMKRCVQVKQREQRVAVELMGTLYIAAVQSKPCLGRPTLVGWTIYFTSELFCHSRSNLRDDPAAPRQKYISG